ncbi:amidohydrolase family protein [bacterium]|nr:amidohydrolase family protein [bacterium]
MSLYESLKDEIYKIPIVDTHEHLMSEEQRNSQPIDVFYFFAHYASSDLVSAGMSPQTLEKIRNTSIPLEERWCDFSPYWARIQNTAYAKTLQIAVRDLFGIDGINERTYIQITEKLRGSQKKGWYRYVLREKGNIVLSLQYVGTMDVDKELFLPVAYYDHFITARSKWDINSLERNYGVSIHSLDDFLKALDIAFERDVKAGAVGIKSGLAYSRILRYDKVSKVEAERLFNRIFSHLGEGLSWEEAKPLQDFIMHEVIRRAISYNLPITIHTGLQEGNANIISNANPVHLVNLFLEYKEAKFDIFHGGYPYTSELATLAKNFRNVYIDMCWLHIISPYVSRRVLHEWLETVPQNKIMGFGGDYIFVEGAYAHSRIARDDIAKVLSEKVEEGYFSEEEALNIAYRLLRDNPKELFNLKI